MKETGRGRERETGKETGERERENSIGWERDVRH